MSSSRSCGRARLPQWVVRIRSVLRFIAALLIWITGAVYRQQYSLGAVKLLLCDVCYAGMAVILDSGASPAYCTTSVVGLGGASSGAMQGPAEQSLEGER